MSKMYSYMTTVMNISFVITSLFRTMIQLRLSFDAQFEAQPI